MQSHTYWRMLGLEQKRCYRRNMLAANAIVTTAVVVGLLIAGFTVGRRGGYGGGGGFEGGGPTAGEHTINMIERSRTLGQLAGGFIKNITIVPDDYSHELPVVTMESIDVVDAAWWQPDPLFAGEVGTFGDGDGSGLFEGALGADFGLPVENWWDQVGTPVHLPQLSGASHPGENREAMIMVSRIAWPGLPAQPSDTGLVVVDITIGADATIEYAFVLEEPPGLGFRRVTERALVYDYEYLPRIVNGRAVETTIRLVVTICRNCDLVITEMNEQSVVQFGLKE